MHPIPCVEVQSIPWRLFANSIESGTEAARCAAGCLLADLYNLSDLVVDTSLVV